jgi:hypothetical protein
LKIYLRSKGLRKEMAEAVRFELTNGSPRRQFSRLVPSTARPRFLEGSGIMPYGATRTEALVQLRGQEPIARIATQQAIHNSRKVIMKMKRISIAALPLVMAAATAFAQAPQSSIRESTDPARVAEVERRAQALRSGQPTMDSGTQQSPGQPQTRAQRPAPGEHGRMHGDRMHGDRMHQKGGHHGHHGMQHHAHPKAAPNSGK